MQILVWISVVTFRKLLFSRWLVIHKKWEFSHVLNTLFLQDFCGSLVCFRQTTKPSYSAITLAQKLTFQHSSSQLLHGQVWCSLLNPWGAHCHCLLPPPAPLSWLHPWKRRLSSKWGRASLVRTCSFLNFQFSHIWVELKLTNFYGSPCHSWHLRIFLFAFPPFTLCIWCRTCQKGHKWEKALDRRWMQTFKANFF